MFRARAVRRLAAVVAAGAGRRGPVRGPQHGPLLRRLRPRPALGQPRPRHPGRPDPAVVRRLRPARLPSSDNPFIGYPLAYQYLTSLRPDAVPATIADLLAMRARGWRVELPDRLADAGPGRAAGLGVPLGHRRAGALAGRHGRRHRRGHDRHALRSAGRSTTTTASSSPDGSGCGPLPGLIVGASAARGEFLDEAIARTLPDRLRPVRADGVRRRRRVLARPLAGPRRADLEPLEPAARRRPRPSPISPRSAAGSRAATASIPA